MEDIPKDDDRTDGIRAARFDLPFLAVRPLPPHVVLVHVLDCLVECTSNRSRTVLTIQCRPSCVDSASSGNLPDLFGDYEGVRHHGLGQREIATVGELRVTPEAQSLRQQTNYSAIR